jgi:hypothetical protein
MRRRRLPTFVSTYTRDLKEELLVVNRRRDISAIGAAVVRAVEAHTADTRLADDLTILLLRRAIVTGAPAPAGV